MKRLNGMLHKCFKKIRIKDTFQKEVDDMFMKHKALKGKSDAKSIIELAELEKKMAEKV